MTTFQAKYTKEERRLEASRVRERYPDRLPLIVEAVSRELQLSKSKYLVPKDMAFGELVFAVRKRMTLSADKALYFFIGNMLVPTTWTVGELYAKHVNEEDGFMYITFAAENTFGGGGVSEDWRGRHVGI